ncbi:hypothetical protein MKW94_015864, partial [Papaver nudicaule]|nr:hypothetical protein [Papaver nudicaule]
MSSYTYYVHCRDTSDDDAVSEDDILRMPVQSHDHEATTSTSCQRPRQRCAQGQRRRYSRVRHFLGKMDVKCIHCGALHFMEEKLTNSSLKDPRFGLCCLQGKIKLPDLRVPPRELKELYEGTDELAKSFRQYIR